MSKLSLLTASVLGVVGVAATSVALADTNMESTYCKPGFYVGVEAGQANTGYNPSQLLAPARASNTAIYGGSSSAVLLGQQVNKIGAGARMFAGYQFNPYFGMEMGYTDFNKTTFDGNGFGTINPAPNATHLHYSGEVTQQATDLVAKATMPLPMGFGAYIDAGAAYVTADRHINSYGFLPNTGVAAFNTIYTKSYQAVHATYGAGLDYTIMNTPVDVSVFYQGIAGGGAIPTTHLWGAGLGYKFA